MGIRRGRPHVVEMVRDVDKEGEHVFCMRRGG
jgi:hypothetical protein